MNNIEKNEEILRNIIEDIDVMTTIQINDEGDVKFLYNKDNMIIPSSIN